MGIDYHVYYGIYIEIKTKGLTRKKEYEYQGCENPECKQYKAGQSGKFCSNCGESLKTIKEQVEEEWYLTDMVEELGIEDQVYPDHSEETNGDTQVWYPRYDSDYSGGCNVKYDNLWVDLTDLDIKAEIEKVKKDCSKALSLLEKAYGVKPTIKWGIISSTG
jgi:hypothetical protein